MKTNYFAYAATIFMMSPLCVLADEKLKGIACRSVHLGYPAPEGIAFYNEIEVKKSADGSYFMVCGWSKGYFGIQELGNGKKLLIFSVWDPGNQNDPKSVKEDQRVKLLHQDKDVRIGRFGNEGTGGQSFFDYEWKAGETYRFMVSAAADGAMRTAYTGWFFHPDKKEWKKLVTFSTITKGTLLAGYYSFIEDFRRNKVSTMKEREALFSNGWVFTKEKKWITLDKARFTGDANPVLNINAKLLGDRFYLGTGGAIENKDVKLRETITRPARSVVPKDLDALLK